MSMLHIKPPNGWIKKKKRVHTKRLFIHLISPLFDSNHAWTFKGSPKVENTTE